METRPGSTPQPQLSQGAAAQHDQSQQRQPDPEHSHIQGWGVDLDPANRPAYPKERTPPRLEGVHWEQPAQQPVTQTVFHSIERPGITPIFGTSVPPTGFSGKIRAWAFRFSESDLRHWMLLMLADRINMFEGVGQDLRDGRVPNVFAEMGVKAQLKHNPAGLARKALVASAMVGIGYYLVKRRNSR